MSSQEKSSHVGELFLESDLEISSSDIRILRRRALDPKPELRPYFEFLEETGAFESRKPRAKLFDEKFVL